MQVSGTGPAACCRFLHPPFLWSLYIHFKNFRIPGLHPAVEDNRRLQADMKAMNSLFATMDIGGRFETGEKSPEEFLQGTGGGIGVVDQDEQRARK
jgi:hypothetical protein